MSDTDYIASDEYFAWCLAEDARCRREKFEEEERKRLVILKELGLEDYSLLNRKK